MGVRVSRVRKISPQEQWKNLGRVPRVEPWVPLPEPGGPMMRIALKRSRGGWDIVRI